MAMEQRTETSRLMTLRILTNFMMAEMCKFWVKGINFLWLMLSRLCCVLKTATTLHPSHFHSSTWLKSENS